MPIKFGSYFPFRRDNRKSDGTWDAPDATDDNIKGTSVDPYDPVWPRWKQKPPPHGEGDFVSHDPFFDIDEITESNSRWLLRQATIRQSEGSAIC